VSPSETERLAREAIELLIAAGRTVAVAESLTGGLVAAALTSVPGSSAAFRGGVVAYATELKIALLGVPAELLARHGPVHAEVAAAMASGVRERLSASFGLATTGVAGPGPADGHPAGTVFVSVAADESHRPPPDGLSMTTYGLRLAGDRYQVRAETVRNVLSVLVGALREDQN
jgi:nicotinamide-nucleotide amidase